MRSERKVSPYWSEDEIELLIINWPIVNNFSLPNRAIKSCSAKAQKLGLVKSQEAMREVIKSDGRKYAVKWTIEEDEILTKLWEHTSALELPNRHRAVIDHRAKKLGLTKTKETLDRIKLEKSTRITLLSKSRARDLNPENLKLLAVPYRTIQEFKYNDPSAYRTSQLLGIFEDVTSHMVDVNMNQSQRMLYEIVCQLFPTETVNYNDRQRIKPLELDVFVTDKNIAFELDGDTYHNPETDAIKDLTCKTNNIELYRVRYWRKGKQITNIASQLETLGFNVSNIDLKKAEMDVFDKCMHKEEMKRISLTYDSYTEFYKNNQTLVKNLRKINLLDEYTSHMTRRSNGWTDIKIIDVISKMTYKKELLDYKKGLYLQAYKSNNPVIVDLFKNMKNYNRRI